MDGRARWSIRRAVELSLGLVMVLGLVWIAWGIGAHAGAMAAGERFERGAPWEPRLTQIFDHDFEPSALAFSPDGHYLAVGGGLHRAVMVWDLRNGHLVRRLEDEKGGVTSLAWSRDGRRLVAGRSFTSGSATLPSLTAWDTSTWDSAYRAMGPFEPVYGHNDVVQLAVGPDSDHLGVSYNKGPVGLHSIATGALIRLLIADSRVGGGIAFGPDGTQLVASAGRYGESLDLFAVDTGALLARYPSIADAGRWVSWQPTGHRQIASTGSHAARVTLWDSVERVVLRTLDDPVQRLYGLSFSPDGRWLATVATGVGVVVRVANTPQVAAVIRPHPSTLIAAAWSHDTVRLATAQGGQAQVWDLSDLTVPR
jgi:WD40 repeat protein